MIQNISVQFARIPHCIEPITILNNLSQLVFPSSATTHIMSKVTRFAAQGMTLTTAESIANAAICHAFNSDFPPVTVVVLDSAGHVVVSKRMDGCPPMGNILLINIFFSGIFYTSSLEWYILRN